MMSSDQQWSSSNQVHSRHQSATPFSSQYPPTRPQVRPILNAPSLSVSHEFSRTARRTGFEGGVGFDAATIDEKLKSTEEQSVPQFGISTGFGHHETSFGPSGTSFAPSGTSFAPSGTSFGPSGTSFAPSGTSFGPSGTPFVAGVISSPFQPSESSERRPVGFVEGLVGQMGGSDVIGNKDTADNGDEFEDEPPLLEELGINPDHIAQRMKAALLFYKLDHDLLVDVDMCGPLFIAACLGCSLLLSGKIHFGYIYGLSVTGCLSMCILLNLMSQQEGIDLYRTTSILGYGLLPVDGLAFISIFFSLRNLVGTILSVLCVTWCTATASRFFETALQMHHQRFLVAYPVALIYACFVLITVF